METEREIPEAEKLNTYEDGNPAGKPVQDGTEFDPDAAADDDREQIPEDERDDVWAEATLLGVHHDEGA